MTCGLGNIGAASITSLAKDLRLALMNGTATGHALDPVSYTIEEVAHKARQFLFEDHFLKLPSAERPSGDMSFYVGGYSANAEGPERWLVKINADTASSPAPICLGPRGQTGISWGGQPEAIHRLFLGVGLGHYDALAAAGLTADQVSAASQSMLASMQAPLMHPAMPVQDAIDLADFLVETTKRFVRFLPGADTVGGDTDIAVVTKHEGFKWVRRKHYFDATLNPREVPYGKRNQTKEVQSDRDSE
jgi:hypothetical protein